MAQDPMATFGALLTYCISDNHDEKSTRVVLEGTAFLLLGVISSVLTAYAFAALGLLV